MKLLTLLAASTALLAPVASAHSPSPSGSAHHGHGFVSKLGCRALKAVMWDRVHLPSSEVYISENLHFWSATTYATPACVFTPESAKDVSRALRLAALTRIPIAVRGAGHLAVPGVSNVDGGVLVALSRMQDMSLSDEKDVVSIGPGLTWNDVYEFLEPDGLVAVGGRLSPVGVSGLLLAGGVSFYGSQYGWAADNIVNYELVLPTGRIVSVNADTNPDLFWALKGGSSNFGIVTRFDLRTHHSPLVWAGIHTVAEEHLPEFNAAIAKFATVGALDPLAATAPAIISPAANITVGGAILFYDSATESYPEALKMFTDIPSLSSSVGFKTLGAFTREVAAATKNGQRQTFCVGSTLATSEAMDLIADTFTPAIGHIRAAAPSANSTVSVTIQTITKAWLERTAEAGGSPLALDPERAPYFVHAQYVEWHDEADDEAVYDFVLGNEDAISDAAKGVGLWDQFKYLGDAARGQDILGSYGEANVARLREIASSVDPKGIWGKLLPGGFKIGGVVGKVVEHVKGSWAEGEEVVEKVRGELHGDHEEEDEDEEEHGEHY
ncbi:hypothetical protein EDC01DRAFT_616895 [Geopyxis carbonaria]|nr:hypothetical protein EDC01DRAFT_616895 [Geopyxis carbonaria]